MIGNRGRAPRGGQFHSLRCASELPTARGRGLGLTWLSCRAYFRKRHPRPQPQPRPPAVAVAGTGARPRPHAAPPPQINSTDKRERRATTRYVIPAGRTARRAKCDVVVRPLRVPRSDKLRTYARVTFSLFLLAHFSLALRIVRRRGRERHVGRVGYALSYPSPLRINIASHPVIDLSSRN